MFGRALDRTGVQICDESAREPERVQHLIHLVHSHHERPEYGAARPPLTPEAHVLCQIDRLDATLHLVD